MSSDGWWSKKRNVMAPTIQKSSKRAPSHVKTQVHDVGYKKLNAICDRFITSMSADTLVESSCAFRTEMTAFLGRAGEELIERMSTTKKLEELVVFKINSTHNALNAFKGCEDFHVAHNNVLYSTFCFPYDTKSKAYDWCKAAVRALHSTVGSREPARAADQPTWTSDEEEEAGRPVCKVVHS